MTAPRRAITVVAGVAQLQTAPGPALVEYVYLLDLRKVFRWSPGTSATDDGRTAINASGGFPGAWLLVRADDLGADLSASAAQTLTVGQGNWRRIPVATLTSDIVLTMSDVSAKYGEPIEISRFDVGAFTVAIVNGGPGGGTLVTLPVSQRSYAIVAPVTVDDVTNWVHRRSGLML